MTNSPKKQTRNLRGDEEETVIVRAGETRSDKKRVLLLTPQSDHWVGYFGREFQVDHALDVQTGFGLLQEHKYWLLVLEETLFDNEIYETIVELNRLNPLMPIVVSSMSPTVEHQLKLMQSGAEDVVMAIESRVEISRRLNLLLQRHEQRRNLIEPNRKLYAITLLTRHLLSTDPRTLISQTIDAVSKAFGLYGVAIALSENATLQFYSSRGGEQFTLSPISIEPDMYDPFYTVIDSGVIKMFDDISLDPHYQSLPRLQKAKAAIILPLQHQLDTLGVMAVFKETDEPFSFDDLVIYEIVANLFTAALQNAYFTQVQSTNAQLNRTLLRAWQSFLTLDSFDAIADMLSHLLQEIPSVGQVAVWFSKVHKPSPPEINATVDLKQPEQILEDLMNNGQSDYLLQNVDEGLRVVSQLGRSSDDPLMPLFRALRTRQLIVAPIIDSARLNGCIAASIGTCRPFTPVDASLIKGLSHAAGHAFERLTLLEESIEKSGRLEAILRSITEGIFLVDSSGYIVYCNAQIMEFTNIKLGDILGQTPDVFLNLLAQQAANPETTQAKFNVAISSLQNGNGTGKSNYPIVELAMKRTDLHIDVEFLSIISPQAIGWIGLVRNTTSVAKPTTASEAVDLLLHTIHATGTQLRHVVNRLIAGDAQLPTDERKFMLEEVQQGLINSEQLLKDYSKSYYIDIGDHTHGYQSLHLDAAVRQIVTRHFQAEFGTRIRIQPTLGMLPVVTDPLLLEQVVVRLLHNAMKRTGSNNPVVITLQSKEGETLLIVQEEGISPITDVKTQLVEPIRPQDDETSSSWSGASLYYTLTQLHHGRIWVENISDTQQNIFVSFNAANPHIKDSEDGAELEVDDLLIPNKRTPQRSPHTVMVIQGKSRIVSILNGQLKARRYEIHAYDSAEEAIRNVGSTHLDLIIVDGNLTDAKLVDVCAQLRKRTETPMVVIASKASDSDRVQALKVGADDFITEPISFDELLAKISALFKRQQIPDRTQEPLDLGDLVIDFARREVFVNGKAVSLTRIEYDLLRILVVNRGHILTHRELLQSIWGPEYHSETQYLWVNTSRLRKKLEPTTYIENHQGVGYMFQKA